MKKIKYKTILRIGCIAGVVLIGSILIAFFMTMRKPKLYKPVVPQDANEVSPYLTHYLAPGMYNNIQLDEPFEIIVTQQGLNDIVSRWQWPQNLGGVLFLAPAVAFSPDRILFMGTVNYAGFPVVITIVTSPALNEDGTLSLNLQKVKAGILNITFFARILGGKIFAHQIQKAGADKRNDWLRNLSQAFLENKPFDPVFPAYDMFIRVTKAEILNQKLILNFEPKLH